MTTTAPAAASGAKRALIVLTSATPTMADGKKSGYYWSEVYHPYETFTKSGYEVDAVSLTGTASPDEHSVTTSEQLMAFEISALAAWNNSNHPLHQVIKAIRRPEQIRPEDYSIIFFAGGHATLWDFPSATPLHEIAAKVYEHGGVVSAVCHGPAVLGGLKLSNGSYIVQGKRASGFTVEEEDKVGLLKFLQEKNIPLCADLITKSGGTYVKGDTMKEFVVNDGRLVTGQNPTSAEATAKRAVDVVEGRLQ